LKACIGVSEFLEDEEPSETFDANNGAFVNL
jgi:hypothetical protein